MKRQFQYTEFSIMEQIETCWLDKTITEVQRELMLIGLFMKLEEAMGFNGVYQVHIIGGPVVTNPFRYEDVPKESLLMYAEDEEWNEEDEGEYGDDDDEYGEIYGRI